FFFGTLKFFPTIVLVPLSEMQRSSASERPPRPRTSATTTRLVLIVALLDACPLYLESGNRFDPRPHGPGRGGRPTAEAMIVSDQPSCGWCGRCSRAHCARTWAPRLGWRARKYASIAVPASRLPTKIVHQPSERRRASGHRSVCALRWP